MISNTYHILQSLLVTSWNGVTLHTSASTLALLQALAVQALVILALVYAVRKQEEG